MSQNAKNFRTNRSYLLIVATLILTLVSASSAFAETDAKSAELINKLVSVNGGYKKLLSKKDVKFNYVYDNHAAGKDVSSERHIFKGEHSWGSYTEHKRNVLPDKEGLAVQSLVYGRPALSLEGKKITDEKAIGGTVFLRKVNFYWFAMMYKLKDPGTNYKHLGTEKVDGILYDKVSLTYNSGVTKKEANDEYILYFNPKTHLVDQFFFSLPAFGFNKPILKMTLAYEVIDGLYVSTVRKSYAPNKEGKYTLNGTYTFSDITFNNGFKPRDFVLKFK